MKKRDDVLVGIVMALAIIVAIVGSLWLARGGLSKGYALYAKFPWSSGLKQGQPVLLAGVNVGYVDQVELRQDGTVLTTFRVGKSYKVPQGTVATVIPNGIFGDMAIKITTSKCTTTEIQKASRRRERSRSSSNCSRRWGVRSKPGGPLSAHKASCCSSLVGSSVGLSGGIKIEAIRLDQVRPELNHLDALRPSGSAILPR